MLAYDQYIDDTSLTMMRRVLESECIRREINLESSQGEDLALIVINAFIAGIDKESELMELIRTQPL